MTTLNINHDDCFCIYTRTHFDLGTECFLIKKREGLGLQRNELIFRQESCRYSWANVSKYEVSNTYFRRTSTDISTRYLHISYTVYIILTSGRAHSWPKLAEPRTLIKTNSWRHLPDSSKRGRLCNMDAPIYMLPKTKRSILAIQTQTETNVTGLSGIKYATTTFKSV
jgi:hypothetical protein